MDMQVTQFIRVYGSDDAYTAGLLLALGLLGTASGIWIRLAM